MVTWSREEAALSINRREMLRKKRVIGRFKRRRRAELVLPEHRYREQLEGRLNGKTGETKRGPAGGKYNANNSGHELSLKRKLQIVKGKLLANA